MSFARLVLSTACIEEMPSSSGLTLPPRDIATGLVQSCIAKVLILYPVISDTALFGSLESVYQHGGRFSSPWDRWCVRMVLAIAYMCHSRAHGDLHYRNAVSHASVALEHRESVIQPGSMTAVQAILLLVVFSMLDPSHFSCWYLVGVASRVMVDIGLHQDPTEDVRVKRSHLESRRCVFYCVYTLDRCGPRS